MVWILISQLYQKLVYIVRMKNSVDQDQLASSEVYYISVRINKIFKPKNCEYFSYQSILTCVFGTQKSCLNEMVLLGTQN